MRVVILLSSLCLLFSGCDESRVYEQNTDFQDRYWLISEKPEFEFTIDKPADRYTLYGNVRNTISYPYARLFFNYSLQDSTGAELEKKLVTQYLFDSKTGEPFGNSGLGDIYDHRFELLKDYQFKYRGKYKVKFEQLMRVDTLQGILAVGLRVENNSIPK
ncbi:gliding motility lipoprotein GldH [Chryseolinea sp. H1M3-3]|uniref:gliding motility lipoprotein GldH n=1 Tax=Chryseolinea sp. H1M3-3 TaxID=3034144 RepID=UPI0023EC6066|nr:gliding motility lipoprotein GldH [Chryseolinea sp. H1M3-3]